MKTSFFKTRLITALLGAFVLTGCASTEQASQSKPALAAEDQIKNGMTKDEVQQRLGKPASVTRSSDGTETWAYNDTAKALIPFYAMAGGKFNNIQVKFGPDGRVAEWTTSNASMF